MSDLLQHIAIVHGPNLNMLGLREPDVYGHDTLDDVNQRIEAHATQRNVEVTFFQSNHEGELVTHLQSQRGEAAGIIFNPGAYTHTSVALRDAVIAAAVPVIEVHMSNIHAREEFRHKSFISGVARGVICGLGAEGYLLALDAFASQIEAHTHRP